MIIDAYNFSTRPTIAHNDVPKFIIWIFWIFFGIDWWSFIAFDSNFLNF